MIKFKSKNEGVLKINDLLLQGYDKNQIRKMVGLEVQTKENKVKIFKLNNKKGSIYCKIWSWREKLLINMLG